MAINVLDGFENSASADGSGAYGFGRDNAYLNWGYGLGANVTTGYFGWHWRGEIQTDTAYYWRESGTVQFSVVIQNAGGAINAGSVTLYRGSLATVVATITGLTIPHGVFNWIEGSFTIGDSGAFTLYINGTLVMSASGVDIQATANNYADTIYHSHFYSSACVHDNLYLFDSSGPAPYNGNIGEIRIVALRPNGVGSTTQFVSSAGANWQAVDEVTSNGDTDYVYTGTAPKKDLYAMSDYSGVTPSKIFCVAITTIGRKDDVATRTYRAVVKSGVSQSVGATQTAQGTYNTYRDYFQTDPETGLEWTVAKLNSMEVGVEALT